MTRWAGEKFTADTLELKLRAARRTPANWDQVREQLLERLAGCHHAVN